MVLERFVKPKERMEKLEGNNDELFKEAYLELKKAVKYAKENFSNTAIYPQLQKALEHYTPKYEKLTKKVIN